MLPDWNKTGASWWGLVRTFMLQLQLPELWHKWDTFAELQLRGAWGTLGPSHAEVILSSKLQVRLQPQTWLSSSCPNKTGLFCVYNTRYARLFLLPVCDHSVLPPPLASTQIHFFWNSFPSLKSISSVYQNMFLNVKFRKLIISLPLTSLLLSCWLNYWSFTKL